MDLDKTPHEHIRDLLIENKKLLTENNAMLKKLRRDSVLSFWFRIIGFLVLVGAPVYLYYYVVVPYLDTINQSIESFSIGIEDVPGLQQLKDAIDNR